jgi:nickel/cobalt exporter
MKRQLFPLMLAASLLAAHPMGNFSVSHYTRLEVSAHGVDVTYVLDLAETPTYELLRDWKLNANSPPAALEEKAREQARQWMSGLDFRVGGKRVEPSLVQSAIALSAAPGGLATARIASTLHLDAAPGRLEFEDHNYAGRGGWKEIAIGARDGASIVKASQTGIERSGMLTSYPAQPPPRDLRAAVEWRTGARAASSPKIVPIEQPKPVEAESSAAAPNSGTPAREDFLARLLGKKQIGLGLMLAGIAVAFGLGAVHALSPGHGKTIVAAYLVGSRGTMPHAAFLGAMVTFTHTISVFALGLATLFLSRYVVPGKIIPVLGAISGLSIIAIGAWLFSKRLRQLRAPQPHSHDHPHDHDHGHTHEHFHEHGGGHTHVPQGDITLGSLIALGASGGLVPCPSALVLLLSSIALGHIGAGLILLVAFSFGLAGVLMSIGMLVLYAKHLLPDPAKTSRHPAFRLIPVLSALVIVCVGVLMTGVSLGWVRPGGLAG